MRVKRDHFPRTLLKGEHLKGHLTSSSYTSMSWTTFGWPWHAFNNWISREVSIRRLMIFTAYSTLVTLWMHFLTTTQNKSFRKWFKTIQRMETLQEEPVYKKLGLLAEWKKCPWIGFSASKKMEWIESIHLTSRIKMSMHPNIIPSKAAHCKGTCI